MCDVYPSACYVYYCVLLSHALACLRSAISCTGTTNTLGPWHVWWVPANTTITTTSSPSFVSHFPRECASEGSRRVSSSTCAGRNLWRQVTQAVIGRTGCPSCHVRAQKEIKCAGKITQGPNPLSSTTGLEGWTNGNSNIKWYKTYCMYRKTITTELRTTTEKCWMKQHFDRPVYHVCS